MNRHRANRDNPLELGLRRYTLRHPIHATIALGILGIAACAALLGALTG